MKNTVKTIFCLFSFLLAASAWAEERRVAVTLKLPDDFVAKTCPAPVWKGTSILWKGTTDTRGEKEIGRQTKKKGKDVVLVDAEPPIETVVDAALSALLPACGVKLVSEGRSDITMSGEVAEFYAGVEKKLLTGKGMARSRLLFRLKRPSSNVDRTVEVGYEMEDKRVRQKDIRQLEKSLNELLARTLEQIPKLDGFREL
ncbi:MAG TPA: YajG family lipoprotein [bacterium]|nr:YajG family lipoprotein [bacterium]